jgi:hypothetical protein
MPDYLVYGGCLRSDLTFPELREVGGVAPSWTLRYGTLGEADGGEIVGETSLSSSCHVRVSRAGDGYRYAHSCTGMFEVSSDGTQIVYQPAAHANPDIARTDLVSRVLLLCVEQRSVLWLHGSAVSIGSSAVGFLGISGTGKSTTGLALARAGARHICDDTLPVEIGDTVSVWESDRTLRLNGDSRRMLAGTAPAVRRDSDGKFVITHEALAGHDRPDAVGKEPMKVPLAALYLLEQHAEADADTPAPVAVRERIDSVGLIRAIMPHVKVGPVVRDGAPSRMLFLIAALARRVPVYRLRVARDWARLDELSTRIIEWHTDAVTAESARCAGP